MSPVYLFNAATRKTVKIYVAHILLPFDSDTLDLLRELCIPSSKGCDSDTC
jgi:hypothetical protein